MNQMRRIDSRSQRGMSLAEVMVASAIFLVILVAALMIYDQSNQIFKTSVESADLQQNTRAGFDQLIADVRMAGFDADRDGVPARAPAGPWQPSTMYSVGAIVSPTVANGYSYRAVTGGVSGAVEPNNWPQVAGSTFTGDGSVTWLTLGPVYQQADEQIEFAGRSAITIRGNLDYNVVTAANPHHGREPDYEPLGGQFPIVTTANDEIVTYALRSVNGPNPDTLTFFADVSVPRSVYPGGSPERRVSIPNVDLCTNGCQNPPYSLWRFVLDEDGNPEGTVVANNVRNLEFFYYQDMGGRTLVKNLDNTDIAGAHGAIGGDGQYNPANIGGTTNWAHRAIRSRVQTVRVQLVGMNDAPDRKYTNTGETLAAAKNYRTYALESLVTPRNLGLSGLAEPDTKPPGPPTVTSVCVGSCLITRVRWNPPLTGNVDSYEVRWDVALNGNYNNIGVVVPGDVVSAPVFNLNPGTQYFFRVVAINENGTARSENALSRTPVNSTRPGPVTNLTATTGAAAEQNRITLSWTAPTNNDPTLANISCEGLAQNGATIDAAEPIRFRVYRGTTEEFNPITNPSSAEIVLDTPMGNPRTVTVTGQPTFTPGGTIVWTDDVSNSLLKPPANCKNYWYRVQVYDACARSTVANENNPANADTGTSAIFPRADSTGFDPGRNGYASSTVAPSAPQELEIDFTNGNSRCNRGLNSCDVKLMWDPVTTDTSNPTNTITIDQYRISRERKKASDTTWLFDTHLPVIENASVTPSMIENGKIVYHDTSADDHDEDDRRKWYYRYTVTALQCGTASAASAPVEFPESCGLAGSTVIESGASSGNGSLASPWVMGANDSIQVIPPANVDLDSVEFEVYPEPDTNTNNAALDRHTASSAPFIYSWENQSDGQVFRVVITMTNENGCTEQTERFIQDDPVACASATITQTGAAQGSGTQALPWFMDAGDTITVNPPPNSPIASVVFTLFLDPGNTTVGSPSSDVATPFTYQWTDKIDNQRYRVLVSVVYVDGCSEVFERYIVDAPPPVCSGATMSVTGASSGAGTLVSPWVVNAGDVLTIDPPTNGLINQVVFTTTAVNPATAPTPAVGTDSTSPFTFTWTDQTDNATYRIDAVITYANCSTTETVTVYVKDEVCAGATVSQTGSTGAGTGLTTVSPWVFDAGDRVTVGHASATITDVTFRLFNEPGTTALTTSTDTTSPYDFTWIDRVNDALYRLEITVTYTPGCTETLTRYIRDQGTCFITASTPTVVGSEQGNDEFATITFQLSNPTAEALTLSGIQVGWLRDAGHPQALLDQIQFIGATTSTLTVAAANGAPPTTGLLTVTGAPTIPANTSSYRVAIRFYLGRKQDVDPLTSSWINSLCLRYTAPSFGGSTASCNVLGSTNANPTSCN